MLPILLLCAGLSSPSHAENHKVSKTNYESPNALQLMVNAPFKDVLESVQAVAADTVIYGTQQFQREKNLIGAHSATSAKAFGDMQGQGSVLYKVADSVLSPLNFKNSADMGTITVRYVVTPFDEKNTSVRIDAVFIENSSRKIHESDGSVEAAEFGEIRRHVEDIEAKHELEKQEEARIAREREEKQAELDLAFRQERATTQQKAAAPMSADLEQRVAQLRKQAEMRVTSAGSQLKTAPYRSAATVQSLPPYTDVVVLIVTPYWYGIQTADGHRGWIHHSELEMLP